ncbi:MAG: LamB/YcsF family protein [Actinomycetota bacterium]|nr:LamB/YcsF family protein [Actinomycetota bacterium]
MHRVDLNCDMGESFGAYSLGNDDEILEFVTSANIACGFHAGDPSVMKRTVHSAVEKGVAIGAHPGYRDLEGFGRRFVDVTPDEAYDLVVYQVGALCGFLAATGARMQHVKPHGAFYNAAAVDIELSGAIAKAVRDVNPELILFGLSGSELISAGEKAGLRTASEAFADRTYQPDGKLTSRRQPGAMIEDLNRAADQAVRLVREGRVASLQGVDVDVRADTICIHGDGPHALEFARMIRARFEESGIEVKPVGIP